MLGFQQVGADDRAVLDHIIDSLTSLANPNENSRFLNQNLSKISLKLGKVQENGIEKELDAKKKAAFLILGAGGVCQPAAEMLSSIGRPSSSQWCKTLLYDDLEDQTDVKVIVGSLYLKDAEQIIEGIPNVTGIQLDVMDRASLWECISQTLT
ncbi:alpha-aminoadipic semialdehyde synthase-like isoform X1 [Gastrolobium bilobum]|uniref:alpha-aminoadipic semialdehyde synthase-like isoform X1 n=1 Tax=Gastrolobium bilobum TaxID=150636 RepID=UPI002AB02C0B|nr:alpha-aminoadipic semialdehyde synthase-like isoform X1 [Gastrolobium bilobum]